MSSWTGSWASGWRGVFAGVVRFLTAVFRPAAGSRQLTAREAASAASGPSRGNLAAELAASERELLAFAHRTARGTSHDELTK